MNSNNQTSNIDENDLSTWNKRLVNAISQVTTAMIEDEKIQAAKPERTWLAIRWPKSTDWNDLEIIRGIVEGKNVAIVVGGWLIEDINSKVIDILKSDWTEVVCINPNSEEDNIQSEIEKLNEVMEVWNSDEWVFEVKGRGTVVIGEAIKAQHYGNTVSVWYVWPNIVNQAKELEIIIENSYKHEEILIKISDEEKSISKKQFGLKALFWKWWKSKIRNTGKNIKNWNFRRR